MVPVILHYFRDIAGYLKKLDTSTSAHIRKQTSGININNNVMVTGSEHCGLAGKVKQEITADASMHEITFSRFAYIISVNGVDVKLTNAEFVMI